MGLAGKDKYRRFALMIPTQEEELQYIRARAAEKQRGVEKDMEIAREKLKPEGRKKTAARIKANSPAELAKNNPNTKRFEKKILEKTGTREAQISRLPGRVVPGGATDNG